jgi:CRP-like cAMP-binding protein
MAYGWRALSGHLVSRSRLPVLGLPDRLLAQLGILARDFGRPMEGGTRIELRVTHAQLAALVGGSRAAVCRALGLLAGRGSVALDGDRFVLPYPDQRLAANVRG